MRRPRCTHYEGRCDRVVCDRELTQTSPARGPRALSLALGAVRDIAEYVARGDMVLASQARRTLNELCWSPSGYPPAVQAALRQHGLRVDS